MNGVLKAWNRIIGRLQNVNASGNALHVIEEEDAAIHQGEGWVYGAKVFLAPAGQAGASVIFAGTTGPDKRVHFQDFSLSANTGPIEVEFYKDCAISSGTGTEVYALNRRFDITDSSDLRIFTEVTVTTTGTLVIPTVNLASPTIGGRSTPSGAGFFHGFVLAVNQTAAIHMTNTSVDTATLWTHFLYHEPDYL